MVSFDGRLRLESGNAVFIAITVIETVCWRQLKKIAFERKMGNSNQRMFFLRICAILTLIDKCALAIANDIS